jgi:O-succinylbenzoate synthase
LGGTNGVTASAAIGLDHEGQPDRRRLEAVADAGYHHAKLKISPATDPAGLSDLKRTFPEVTLALDANESLGAGLTERLKSLDSLGFAYIEQPGAAEDLTGHARLRRELTTPIALDESASSVAAIKQILHTNATDIVNLKAGRFGTTETLTLAKRIAAAGLRVRLGGLVETGIGRAHAVALATCPEFSVVGDIAGSDLYFDNDLVDPTWRIEAGQLRPSDRPGIGVEVDVAAVERFAFDCYSVGQT